MRGLMAMLGLPFIALACTHRAPAERTKDVGESARPALARVDAGDVGDAGDGGDDAQTSEATDAGERAALGGFPDPLVLVSDQEKLGVVSVPLGAREPRPIMVAIHGGSETPERACAAWRAISEAYPFVVCPRGWGGNERRLGWRDAADTNARIARAIAKTKETFGPWVKDTPSIVLAGFSMGGSQVALVARRTPSAYRRIVVGDSAHDPQPALTFARTWVAGGGERALFLCTTSGCEPSMRAAARKVASEHAGARLNVAPTRVHGLSERAVQSMRRDWPWLVEGTEGWETYSPPSDPSLPGRTETFGSP
jgi:pimeloyl-ACP methyl ester carboxylesterase